MPSVPSQRTPPAGYYNPSPTYSFQTPAQSGPYRIQKPSQRYGSSVDSQAIARAFHAEQWAEQPVYGSLDPQQRFAPAGLHVATHANGSQHQLQYRNGNGVLNSGLSLQDDVSLPQKGLVSNSPAERSLHHKHGAAGRGIDIESGRKEEPHEISNGRDSKGPRGGVASSEHNSLSQSPGVPDSSSDSPDLKSHKICCHGNPHVENTQSENSKLLVLDSNGLPENAVVEEFASSPQYAVSLQDEVSDDTRKVSGHAKNRHSTPLLDPTSHHGNEQTTPYSIPSTYATASQSILSHQTPHLYSQKVPQYRPFGSNGSAAPLTEGNLEIAPAHNCNCGDTCDCLGCAAHPFNATTRNHVQSLGDLLAHGDNEQQPGSRPQSPCGSSFAQSTAIHSMAPGINPRLIENVPSPPVSSHYRSTVLPLTDNEVTASTEPYDEAHIPLFSSSSYYTMEFPMEALGDCTDVSGSCQCGDDCACIGCLTHTGHNGIPLDLDSALVPASPNGAGARQDPSEDDGRDAPAPRKCCN